MSEARTSQLIRLAISKIGGRVFRNHRGKHLTLDGKRMVTTGLFPGASDLIGWQTITITPAMVGKKVAIFQSIEVKSGDGAASNDQKQWLEIVEDAGGIAGVSRSEGEALADVERFWLRVTS